MTKVNIFCRQCWGGGLRSLNYYFYFQGITSLFKLLTWSSFNIAKPYISRDSSISFRFASEIQYRILKNDFMIYLVFDIITPFSSPILLIWIFSFCLLVSLARGCSIMLVFSKNQLFISLTLYYYFLFLTHWF